MEEGIKWKHSNGLTNKNPDYDIGGQPSKFELAIEPKNNLLNDVKSSNAYAGQIDYRCFYLENKYVDQALDNIQISLTSDDLCSTIYHGSKFQNEEQIITIFGEPQVGGYMIIELEFGGTQLTCVYNDAISFASEIQNKIRTVPFCTTVDVTVDAFGVNYVKYKVTFQGSAQHRKIKPIKLIQNNLTNIQGSEYRVAKYLSSDPFNQIGNIYLKVTRNIDTSQYITGTIFIFSISTGTYYRINYSSYSGDTFTTDPLPFTLNRGDEVWVNLAIGTGSPYGGGGFSSGYGSEVASAWDDGYNLGYGEINKENRVTIDISKYQEGYPINQFAYVSESVYSIPDADFTKSVLNIGLLRPQEGFYMWIKRDVPSLTPGCSGSFNLIFNGDLLDIYPNSVDEGFDLGFL